MLTPRPRTTLFMLLATAVILTGCNKITSQVKPDNNMATASTAPISLEALAALGEKWQSKPTDVNRGLAYANGLESVGQNNEALAVYKKLSDADPANVTLAGLYGRKLVAAGRPDDAIPVLEGAEQKGDADWKVMSALGSAYDQTGLYDKARQQYAKALAADPQNLQIMNNLAMSYALQGDLKQAEAELRKCDALPGSKAEPRIRQNLALVIGLQGRFEEASKIAQQDLPPEQVQENMAYLKKMLSQPNTWQQISEPQGQG